MNIVNNPVQPVFIGQTEIRYLNTGEVPSIGKHSVGLFLQRTPKLNLLITYKSINNQESLYVATMAIAARLQRSSIDFNDLSQATFFIGEWPCNVGVTLVIPPEEVLIEINGDDAAKTVSNIIGRMVNAIVSHCMLISSIYYGDNIEVLNESLRALHGLTEKEITESGEEPATYATVIVNDISETVTMENPFSIVLYYVHPQNNSKVWDERFSFDAIKKYGTEYKISVKKLFPFPISISVDNVPDDISTKEKVGMCIALQIAHLAMDMLNHHIIQQVVPPYGSQVPWGSFGF